MIDGKSFFDESVKSDIRAFENIWKVATYEGDECTTGCLLDYNYFNNYYKMIAIDLSKQQALDVDLKARHQINVTGNLDRAEGATMFFITEEAKEAVLHFSQGTVKVLWMCSTFLFCSI